VHTCGCFSYTDDTITFLLLIIVVITMASVLLFVYKLLLECGLVRGAFGEVRLAFMKGSCEKVAVKVIEKKGFTAATATNAVSFLSRRVHIYIQSLSGDW